MSCSSKTIIVKLSMGTKPNHTYKEATKAINIFAYVAFNFGGLVMNKTKELTVSSMCLALGVILPQAFHTIPNAGSILLPMHIPVLLCGFICGPTYGLIVGVLTPILSHLIFSMPPAAMLGQMVIELAMYGLMTGLLNKTLNIKNELIKYYVVLILSMIIGRVFYGIVNALFFKAGSYSLSIWLSTAFVSAIPGIIIQLAIVPSLVKAIKKLV